MTAENFVIETIELEKNIYQGHVLKKLTGHYEKNDTDFPSGCSYIPMNQSLARLIPILLEPQCADSLVAWGAFDRVIVEQWSEKPSLYPVYRISERPPVPMLIEADSHCGQ